MIADFAQRGNTVKVYKIMFTFLVIFPINFLLTFRVKSALEKTVSERLQKENRRETVPRIKRVCSPEAGKAAICCLKLPAGHAIIRAEKQDWSER